MFYTWTQSLYTSVPEKVREILFLGAP